MKIERENGGQLTVIAFPSLYSKNFEGHEPELEPGDGERRQDEEILDETVLVVGEVQHHLEEDRFNGEGDEYLGYEIRG